MATVCAVAAAPAPAAIKEEYTLLADRLKEISALGGVAGLLGWDEQVQHAREPLNLPR